MPDTLRPHQRAIPLAVRVLALAGASLLAACAQPGPPHEAQALGLTQTGADTASLPQVRWWTALGDAKLDTLIDQALAQQPSLAVARARAAQAAALADARHAANGPQAQLTLDATRQRYTANGLVPPPVAGNMYDSANLQASLSWSPDFFGLHRAELEASLGQARAAQADAAAAANTLAAQLARAYVALARVLADEEVAQQALAQRQAIERLTRERVGAGLDSQVELTQTQTALPEGQGIWPALWMLGANFNSVGWPACGEMDIMELIDFGNPGANDWFVVNQFAVIEGQHSRRPDIVAARWRIEAATQGVSAARSEFYPNINLAAFVGLNALGLNRLFEASSRQVGIAPALRLPIFDGGRLRAQLGGRQAELDAVIAQYNGAVLDAVKQAGDGLASAASIARQQALQAQAEAGADKAYRFAQERYGAGLGNYLVVLSTETQVLAQRRQAVALQARALDVRLALMNALGGGWSDDTPALQVAAH